MHVDCAQFVNMHCKLRACARNMCPETLGVVELKQVAQLVHNDVVREVGWEKNDAIIKIEVLLA